MSFEYNTETASLILIFLLFCSPFMPFSYMMHIQRLCLSWMSSPSCCGWLWCSRSGLWFLLIALTNCFLLFGNSFPLVIHKNEFYFLGTSILLLWNTSAKIDSVITFVVESLSSRHLISCLESVEKHIHLYHFCALVFASGLSRYSFGIVRIGTFFDLTSRSTSCSCRISRPLVLMWRASPILVSKTTRTFTTSMLTVSRMEP